MKINPLMVIFVKYILGCNTTKARFPPKFSSALDLDLLNQFGKQSLTKEMLYLAEKFLVQCWGKSKTIATFDELR